MTLIEQQPGRSTEQEVEGKIPLALRHSDSDLRHKTRQEGQRCRRPAIYTKRKMAARVSVAEAYAQLVGASERSSGRSSDATTSGQPPVQSCQRDRPGCAAGAAWTTGSGLHESTPLLNRVGRPGALRPFDPAGAEAARRQRQASMATSIERAKRVARAKWEAERPSVLAELKQNRPLGSDEDRHSRCRRTSSSAECGARRESLDCAWKPPHVAAAGTADPAAQEELARLRMQMQQMKQYVSTMETMVGQTLAREAVAAPQVAAPVAPVPAPTPPTAVASTAVMQHAIPLAPVTEDSAAELESPLSNIDLDTRLLFDTFETAKHACAEVIEAEAEHGDMLERVSTSPLPNEKGSELRDGSPSSSAKRSPLRRSPMALLNVDPNNVPSVSSSPSRARASKSPGSPAAGRGPSPSVPPARAAVSPTLSTTGDSSSATSPAAVTYTEYEEYDSADGSPAFGGVQVCAAVVEDTKPSVTQSSPTATSVEAEKPAVRIRGRLSF